MTVREKALGAIEIKGIKRVKKCVEKNNEPSGDCFLHGMEKSEGMRHIFCGFEQWKSIKLGPFLEVSI